MDLYGLNALQAGLTYLPYGIACAVASFLVGKSPKLTGSWDQARLDTNYNAGKVMDQDYRKTAAMVGFAVDKTKGDDLAKFPIEKARLRSIWYYISISTVCTIGHGWTVEIRTVSLAWLDCHEDQL